MGRSCANAKNAKTAEAYTELPSLDIGIIFPATPEDKIRHQEPDVVSSGRSEEWSFRTCREPHGGQTPTRKDLRASKSYPNERGSAFALEKID